MGDVQDPLERFNREPLLAPASQIRGNRAENGVTHLGYLDSVSAYRWLANDVEYMDMAYHIRHLTRALMDLRGRKEHVGVDYMEIRVAGPLGLMLSFDNTQLGGSIVSKWTAEPI